MSGVIIFVIFFQLSLHTVENSELFIFLQRGSRRKMTEEDISVTRGISR